MWLYFLVQYISHCRFYWYALKRMAIKTMFENYFFLSENLQARLDPVL